MTSSAGRTLGHLRVVRDQGLEGRRHRHEPAVLDEAVDQRVHRLIRDLEVGIPRVQLAVGVHDAARMPALVDLDVGTEIAAQAQHWRERQEGRIVEAHVRRQQRQVEIRVAVADTEEGVHVRQRGRDAGAVGLGEFEAEQQAVAALEESAVGGREPGVPGVFVGLDRAFRGAIERLQDLAGTQQLV